MTISDQPAREPEILHRFKNYLSIIVGFSELLLTELPDGDPRRHDIAEVYKASREALALIPELSRRIR